VNSKALNEDSGGRAGVREDEGPDLGVEGEVGIGVKEKGGEGGVSGGEVRWERGS